MTFIIILLSLILIWMIFGDRIKAWSQRRMVDKMEDMFRQSMGMPTAKEERRHRKQAEKEARRNNGFTRPSSGSQSRDPFRQKPDSILPKEYAEDVEFTEYKEYSSSTTIKSEDSGTETEIKVESQVSDVEFTEIKK